MLFNFRKGCGIINRKFSGNAALIDGNKRMMTGLGRGQGKRHEAGGRAGGIGNLKIRGLGRRTLQHRAATVDDKRCTLTHINAHIRLKAFLFESH